MTSPSFTKPLSHFQPQPPRLYESRPSGPLPGDLLLFSHAVGVTRLVPWFTKSRYYHVAIYEGGPFVLESRPSGVIRRDIVREPGNVFRVLPMPVENGRGERAISYARSCLGARYDVLSIAALVAWWTFPQLEVDYSSDSAFTCTELVLYAWKVAGVDLFSNQKATRVVPGNFTRFLPPDARDQCLHPPYEPLPQRPPALSAAN